MEEEGKSMFTGIVEQSGSVSAIDIKPGLTQLRISAANLLNDVALGDSISVNGVCLTVTDFDETHFSVDAVPETLRCTNLGDLAVGDSVNLERAMKAETRIGGHFVQGHVDATVQILSIKPEGDALNIEFSLPQALRPFVIHKGFVGLDGMSLTVMQVTDSSFSVTLIPHTQEKTVVSDYQVGHRINFEADMTAKYIANMMETYREQAIS